MAEKPAVQQAVQQALSEALGAIQRQLGEVQSSFDQVQVTLEKAGSQTSPERFTALLPPLMHMQAAGAALAASIETVLRFVGVSSQWTGAAALAIREAQEAVAVEQPAAAPAVEEVAEEAAEPAIEEAAAPETVEPAVEEEAAAPVDVSTLPEDLQQLHKKAARFARVTVQELFMYKKDEVTAGRENRDLYQRFKEEIDKSKALYDKRFEPIANHNIDYLYDELVHVLAEDDPGALGDYPYPTPSGN
jgi:hypothetical protein